MIQIVSNGQVFNAPPESVGEDIPPPSTSTESLDPRIETYQEVLFQNTFGEAGNVLLARLNARHEKKEQPIKTPWSTLDEKIGGGLWPGLHFVVGSTGAGKTQFAMQIALKAAKSGVPVLYVALELGELDLLARALGILKPEAGKWSEFFLGHKQVPLDAFEELKTLPFHWIVAPPMGWEHRNLEPNVKALRKLYPNAPTILVVVDFAQLLAGGERELRERISKAAYAGRAVAREHNAAVLMLSSTSRENYASVEVTEKDDKGAKKTSPPWNGPASAFVGLGKESGDTEYASDTVMVLVKEAWADNPSQGGTPFHLAIAKLRAGTPGWVDLWFNGSLFNSSKFNSCDDIYTLTTMEF